MMDDSTTTKELWSTLFNETISATALCSNAVVITVGSNLQALDRSTGNKIWEQPINGEVVIEGLCIDRAGRVIVPFKDGKISCFGLPDSTSIRNKLFAEIPIINTKQSQAAIGKGYENAIGNSSGKNSTKIFAIANASTIINSGTDEPVTQNKVSSPTAQNVTNANAQIAQCIQITQPVPESDSHEMYKTFTVIDKSTLKITSV